MIIFKLISAGFKQNLGIGGSKFYLRGSKKLLKYIYIYIYKIWPVQGVHLNPLALKVMPPSTKIKINFLRD